MLPRNRTCGTRARRQLEQRFSDRLEEGTLSDAKTVLGELVNNAYVHGEGQIEVRLELSGGRLRIEVVDEGSGAAVRVREHGRAGGGHGLQIVQALSNAWGAYEGTTHVWAELDARTAS